MKKMTIVFVDDKTAQVTKAFEKNAKIFGTPEFNLWREYKQQFPGASMTTKSIKKNPNKKTTKNMTYENMAGFIRTQDKADTLMAEFKSIIEKSKIQTNPYRSVLAWFEQRFEGYDNYKTYFAKLAAEQAEENSIFGLSAAKPGSSISPFPGSSVPDKAST